MAREVAEGLDLPLTVLDDLYYGPGLSLRDDFVALIDTVTNGRRWVIDSQGAPLSSPAPPIHRELMWDRADTAIWLDYPKRAKSVSWRAGPRPQGCRSLRPHAWRRASAAA